MKNTKPTYEELEAELTVLKKEIESFRLSGDIEKLKEDLAVSEERCRFLIESIQDVSYTLSPEGILTFVSEAWPLLLGHPVSEIHGRSFVPLIHTEDLPKCLEVVKACKETGQRQTGLEYRIRHVDGTWKWHLSNLNPVKDESGKVISINGAVRDISDRKRVEEELQEKTLELDRYFTSALDLLCIADKQGNFIRVNKEWETALGYSVSELEKRSFLEFVHPDDMQATLDAMARLEKNEEVLNFTNRYRCRDGSYRYIEWRSRTVGNVIYAVARDLTRRMKAEEFVRISEARLRRAELESNSGNWELHLDSRKFSGSDGAKKLYGLNQDDFGYDVLREIPLPEFRPLLDAALENLIKYGEPYKLDFKIRKHDTGEIRDVHSSAIYDKEKRILFGVIQDITESKRVQNAVKESEGKLRTIIETLPDGISITSLEGTVQYVSGQVLRMWGYDSAEEIIGRNLLEFAHPQHRDKAQYFIQEMLNGNYTGTAEYQLVRKDGSNFYGEANANILRNPDNDPIGIVFIIRDITERKIIEQALHESEKTQRNLLVNLHAGVVVHAADTKIIFANDQASRVLGLSIDQLTGKTATDPNWHFTHEDQTPLNTWEYPIARVLETRLPIQDLVHGIFRPAKQDVVWVLINAFPEFLPDGTLHQVVVTFIDITDRKNTEAFLRESEVRFDLALSGTGAGLWDWDMVNNTVFYSPLWKSMLGYQDHEVENSFSGWQKLWHPDDAAQIQDAVNDHMNGKTSKFEVKHRLRNKTGEWRWIMTRGDLIKDSEGKPLRWVGTNIDLTHNLRVEEELRKSEQKYRLLFENLTAGFALHEMIYDENGKPVDYRYIEVNPAFEKLTGAKAADLIGHTVKEVMPDTEAHWIETFGKVAQTGQPVSYQNYAQEIGKYFDTWAFSPAKDRFAVVFSDITERMRHESEIASFNEELAATNEELTTTTDALRENNLSLELAKERAEESDRLKSAFLANMSHEIRTPMNGILGFADLLKEAKLTGEEKQKYISIIEKSGNRMLNIINDLIDISKVESGQMEVSFSRTNINEQLDFLYNFFQSEAKHKGLQLSFYCPLPASQMLIKTDKEKVYAILTNLIKNAIKFTKKGSIEFGYQLIGDRLEFYVKDTGIGIHPDKQKSVFDRFAQADSSISSGYEGAGLGLSIAKAYVEMLGGEIWMESKPGEGSLFFFTLPYNPKFLIEPAAIQPLKTEIKEEIANLSIVIAEDDEESLMFLTILLENLCYKIIPAKNGKEAVDLCLQNENVSLVLMDIKMPVMDGHTAAKMIKEFRPDLPIIAQSAYALQSERDLYNLTFDDYITKPVKSSELLEKIAMCTNGK